MSSVQPRLLVTLPEQVRAVLHVEETVQVLRTDGSSWYRSFVRAHSPFDTTEYVPFGAYWERSSAAACGAVSTDAVASIAAVAITFAGTITCSSRMSMMAMPFFARRIAL